MWRAAVAAMIATAAVTEAEAACRQALALGLDVSGSVDAGEYRLQLDGLANALESPEVREILLGAPDWPVRIAVYEWSGPRNFNRRLLVDWQDIHTETDLSHVTTRLRDTQRRPADPSTALGAAMAFGLSLLEQQSECPKRTLDISGDGKSNTGPRPRDIPLPDWITINGLVVVPRDQGQTPDAAELTAYYTANVLHGVDAFVEAADGFKDYERAMRRKLLRELQGLNLSQFFRNGHPHL
ncbi:DUF1194 domain-containing protein [Shimia sp. SDUM112013]|uniref:DUF1194 domain-containing protein n=1 Tax=Shimia sp. SDUM112013 TaxID=3136160 RepID=UPI0032F07E1B